MWSCDRRHDRRRDQRGVRYAAGVGRPVRPAAPGERLAGDIARRQRQRETQAELVVVVRQRFQVLDLDGKGFARTQVRDRCRKQVGPLLLDEPGSLPAFPGLFVFLSRLFLLPNLAFDKTLPDPHAQAIDSRAVRQRKDVNAFHPFCPVVAEFLAHGRSRDRPADPDVNGGVDAGRDRVARLHLQQQAAGLHLLRLERRLVRHRFRRQCRRCLNSGERHYQERESQCVPHFRNPSLSM